MKDHIKTVILCGGLGTRLREETEFRPKPLVEVGGRPILWHVMKLYAHYGYRDFVLCLGYRGNMIKEYFLNYEAMNNDFTISLGRRHSLDFHGEHDEQDFRVTLAETGLGTPTGGRVKQIEPYVKNTTFMLTYGDGISDVDIGRLLEFHRSHGKIGTVTLVRPISRWGIVELDENGRITRFSEKPRAEGWISAGFFVFDHRVFGYLERKSVLEQEPLRRLVEAEELVAYRHDGFFQPMDTHREYALLNEIWAQGRAPWKVWG